MRRFLRMLSFALVLCACLFSAAASVPGSVAFVTASVDMLTNVFKPSYDPETDTVFISLTAHKTVENIDKVSIGPEGFCFVLENIQTGESVKKISDEKGLAEFILSFSPEDVGKTFTYQLFEMKDGRPGVIYSDQVYQVRINVGRDERVYADVFLNDFPTAIAPFRNVYNSKEDPTLPDTGDHAQPVLYAGMMLAGGAGCFLLRPKKKDH